MKEKLQAERAALTASREDFRLVVPAIRDANCPEARWLTAVQHDVEAEALMREVATSEER